MGRKDNHVFLSRQNSYGCFEKLIQTFVEIIHFLKNIRKAMKGVNDLTIIRFINSLISFGDDKIVTDEKV